MSLVPGFSSNLRLPGAPEQALDLGPEQTIIIEETGGDTPEYDLRGNLIKIKHADGSITISTDGRPIEEAGKEKSGWFDNLVDDIDSMELGRIAEELLRGIDDDKTSRND